MGERLVRFGRRHEPERFGAIARAGVYDLVNEVRMKTLIYILAVTVLVGCAGGPVGWGGTDEVLFSDKDTIKIQWDNTVTSEDAVRQKAIAHCARTNRGAQVVDATSDPFTFGLIQSKTWKCTELHAN